MSFKVELKGFQIALLELKAANMDPDAIHIPGYVRRSGWAPAYIERERARRKRQHAQLRRRIKYLKEQHYIERVKEGEQLLYKLTSQGQFELLRLQFILHMQAMRQKPWKSKFYMVIFDIPEEKKKYRDLFRTLLKRSGFRMLQLSVWMSRYNPHPAIAALLKYLRIEQYFEIVEIDCQACSRRMQRKVS